MDFINESACTNLYTTVRSSKETPIIDAMRDNVMAFFQPCHEGVKEFGNLLNCSLKQCLDEDSSAPPTAPHVFMNIYDIPAMLGFVLSNDINTTFFRLIRRGKESKVWIGANSESLWSKFVGDGHQSDVSHVVLEEYLKTLDDEKLHDRLENLKRFIVDYSKERWSLRGPPEDANIQSDSLLGKALVAAGIDLTNLVTSGDGVERAQEYLDKQDPEVLRDFLLINYMHAVAPNKQFRELIHKQWRKKHKSKINVEYELTRLGMEPLQSYCLNLFPAMYIHEYVKQHEEKIKYGMKTVQDQIGKYLPDSLPNNIDNVFYKDNIVVPLEEWLTDESAAQKVFAVYGDSLSKVETNGLPSYSNLRSQVHQSIFKARIASGNVAEVSADKYFFLGEQIDYQFYPLIRLLIPPPLLVVSITTPSNEEEDAVDAAVKNYSTELYYSIACFMIEFQSEKIFSDNFRKCSSNSYDLIAKEVGYRGYRSVKTGSASIAALSVLSSSFQMYLDDSQWSKNNASKVVEKKRNFFLEFAKRQANLKDVDEANKFVFCVFLGRFEEHKIIFLYIIYISVLYICLPTF
eukprot:GHVR01140764.1.p1 GENE.GHVR01140764.1~~GHVR01140764.1.p1  ORF type:complete len:593 (+),score=76.67 GHVR01140764.1:59-1780(+)